MQEEEGIGLDFDSNRALHALKFYQDTQHVRY